MPRYDLIDSNRHGTRCAGEVAAEGNNSICAVGVAFDAGIGGIIDLLFSSSSSSCRPRRLLSSGIYTKTKTVDEKRKDVQSFGD